MISFFLVPVMAQTPGFPVPPQNPKQLFYLQRPANTNTVIYELNSENGVIDQQNPIRVYWIKYAKDGRREELSNIEKKYAYGIKIKEAGEKRVDFQLVAYKKVNLSLKIGSDEQYHVYANVNNKEMIIKRIYIAVTGGSLFKPNIDHVELQGIDTITGSETAERIKL